MGCPSADLKALKSILCNAKRIVVLTGAGVSAESGVPTFRGSGGFWRTYRSQDLATVGAFKRSPSLVWEFYHYRRELVLTKQPNKAHCAIAEAESKLSAVGGGVRQLTVITQNIDGLHQRGGSKHVIELHGSLYKTQCIKCGDVAINTVSPICPALKGRGAPDPNTLSEEIPEKDLPRCRKDDCTGLVRPYVVWFGENLHPDTLQQADDSLSECDVCLVVGTSSVVYPTAMYAPALAARNVPVAEFNIEPTPATNDFMFHFSGPCTQTVPEVLAGITDSQTTTCQLQGAKNKENSKQKKEKEKTSDSATNSEKVVIAGGDSSNKGGSGSDVGALSGGQKLKRAVRDYGSTIIIFHIGISLLSLGGFYMAFSSGLDMEWLVSRIGLESSSSKVAATGGMFVVAYAVHKVFAPVRISITLATAPLIVRYLRKVGLLKPPNPIK